MKGNEAQKGADTVVWVSERDTCMATRLFPGHQHSLPHSRKSPPHPAASVSSRLHSDPYCGGSLGTRPQGDRGVQLWLGPVPEPRILGALGSK